jgi:hypothetical protein
VIEETRERRIDRSPRFIVTEINQSSGKGVAVSTGEELFSFQL